MLSMGVSSNEPAFSITFFFSKNIRIFKEGGVRPLRPTLNLPAVCQSIVVLYNHDVHYRSNSMKLVFKFYLLASHAVFNKNN